MNKNEFIKWAIQNGAYGWGYSGSERTMYIHIHGNQLPFLDALKSVITDFKVVVQG